MSIPHAHPGDVSDVCPLGEKLRESQTRTLIKTRDLEVIRLILPAGKRIPMGRCRSAAERRSCVSGGKVLDVSTRTWS